MKTSPTVELSSHEAEATEARTREASRARYATARAEVEALLAPENVPPVQDDTRAGSRAKARVARPDALDGSPEASPPAPVGLAGGSGNDGASPTSAEDIRPRRVPRSVGRGRGGVEHKYLQSLVKKLAEERGFTVTIERPVLAGHGHVDVALERTGLSVGVEISVTTPSRFEAGNLVKCLAAGFDYAVLVSADHATLETARAHLTSRADDDRLRFLSPTELIRFLDEAAVSESSRPRWHSDASRARSASPAATRSDGPAPPVLGTADAAAYVGLAVQTLAKLRVTGESPPYFKLGSRVVYNRADLDSWLASRRRRSTSDGGHPT